MGGGGGEGVELGHRYISRTGFSGLIKKYGRLVESQLARRTEIDNAWF